MVYSLWKFNHESASYVSASKIKDTNFIKEVDNWIDADYMNGASFYDPRDYVSANSVQFFNEMN